MVAWLGSIWNAYLKSVELLTCKPLASLRVWVREVSLACWEVGDEGRATAFVTESCETTAHAALAGNAGSLTWTPINKPSVIRSRQGESWVMRKRKAVKCMRDRQSCGSGIPKEGRVGKRWEAWSNNRPIKYVMELDEMEHKKGVLTQQEAPDRRMGCWIRRGSSRGSNAAEAAAARHSAGETRGVGSYPAGSMRGHQEKWNGQGPWSGTNGHGREME